MEITVQFEAQLRHVAGVGHASVSVPDDCSVTDALKAISAKFGPSLGERLLTPDGTTQRSVLLFVNEQPIPHDLASERTLKTGDVLLLYPPISGG
jgi:molybdopterin converting factor small subunit